MSWYVTHRIGGEISRISLIDILSAAAELNLYVEANDEYARAVLKNRPEMRGDNSDLISADGTIAFYSPDHGADSFEALEELCMHIDAPFITKVDGDEDAEASCSWWKSGMDGIGRSLSDHDGQPVLTVKSVVDAIANGTIDTLIAEATIPELPVVSFVV